MGISNPIIPQIQDEGVLLSNRQKINFVGAGVTASLDDGNNRITVEIPGAVATSGVVAHEAEHRTGGSDVFTAALPLIAIPAFDGSYISAGLVAAARIATLSANTIGVDTLGVARIPALNASYVSAGVIGSARVPSNYIISGISMVLDGGGTLVASGSRVSVELPFSATILQVSALSPIVGSIFMNFKSSPVGSYPTLANIGTIALMGTTAFVDSTLTGFTTALTGGNLLELYAIGAVSGVERVTANLKVVRT